MDLGLRSKVALITGGSEGIGKAGARRLSMEGAEVVICARRARNLETAASEIRRDTGREVTTVQADVSQMAQIERLFDTVISTYGRIDILVNNAGAYSPGLFEEVTDEAWQADWDLKLFAAIRCSRLAIPHMKAQGGGRIINVTSVAAKAPGPSSVPTSVSRAAGVALTKAMSHDCAKANILVNTLCIGLIKSESTELIWEGELAETHGRSLDDWYRDLGTQIPLGRVGEAEEAGDIIVFLASDRASYITGVAINIDGGASPVV